MSVTVVYLKSNFFIFIFLQLSILIFFSSLHPDKTSYLSFGIYFSNCSNCMPVTVVYPKFNFLIFSQFFILMFFSPLHPYKFNYST